MDAANTSPVHTEVAAWLDPSGWDAECWPTTASEVEAMLSAHLSDLDRELELSAWLPFALEIWASMDAPETDAQRRSREASERAEMADEWAYRRLVEVQAFG